MVHGLLFHLDNRFLEEGTIKDGKLIAFQCLALAPAAASHAVLDYCM